MNETTKTYWQIGNTNTLHNKPKCGRVKLFHPWKCELTDKQVSKAFKLCKRCFNNQTH